MEQESKLYISTISIQHLLKTFISSTASTQHAVQAQGSFLQYMKEIDTQNIMQDALLLGRLCDKNQISVLQFSLLQSLSGILSTTFRQFASLNNWLLIADRISLIVIKSLKQLIPTKKDKIDRVTSKLSDWICRESKILSNISSYKLLLALVEISMYQLNNRPYQLILQQFPCFIRKLALLEQYIRPQQEILKVMSILFQFSLQIISFNSTSLISSSFIEANKSTLMQKPDQSHRKLDHETKLVLFDILEKYCLVEPQFRMPLLTHITKSFEKKIQSQQTVEIYGVIIKLIKKKLFSDYQEKNLNQLIRIKELTHDRNQFLMKIISIFIDELSQQFVFQYRLPLLVLSISSDIEIKLFSFFYGSTFGEDESSTPQLVNELTRWNIKNGIIPPQEYIDKLKKVGLRFLTEETQIWIYGNADKSWSRLVVEIFENKVKELSEGKLKIESLLKIKQFNSEIQIYCLYPKIFIELITKYEFKRLVKNPPNIIEIHQNAEVMEMLKQQAQIIFVNARKFKICEYRFLVPFVLLNSLLESANKICLEKQQVFQFYLIAIKRLSAAQTLDFIDFLLTSFKIFKNYFTLFLFLGTGIAMLIEPSKLNKEIQNKYKSSLLEIIQLATLEGFAKIRSFHSENLRLTLYLCCFFPDFLLQQHQRLISLWAPLYGQADIEMILSQFDRSYYKKLMDIFDLQFPIDRQGQKLIFIALKQIILLLGQPSVNNCQYLSNESTSINFVPIRQSSQKSNIQIQFKLLINSKILYKSMIQFYGSNHIGEKLAIQKHRIVFKKGKIIFYNRQTKQIEGNLEEISDHTYYRPLTFLINLNNSKLSIMVNKNVLINKDYPYNIDSLRLDLFGQIMVRDFKWLKPDQQEKLLKLSQSYQIFPNNAEVKLSRTSRFCIHNFQEKLNLFYLFTYLEKIIKNNFMSLNVSQFFQYCCKITFKKESNFPNKQQFTPEQFACMRRLFKTILKFNNNVKFCLPQKTLLEINFDNDRKTYYYLVSTILNEGFILQSSFECQGKIYFYLDQLLFGTNSNFRLAIENRKMRVFTNICKVILKIEGKKKDSFSKIAEKIILHHEANDILIKKINYLFYLSHESKSEYLQSLFANILDRIFSVLNHSQNEQNFHIKIIGKYFISTDKNLELIFWLSQIQTKTKILNLMIDDKQFYSKCHGFFQEFPDNELLQLSTWFIVYFKKTIFYFFEHKNRSEQSFNNLIFFAKQIVKIYSIENDESHKDEMVNMITQFLKRSVKLISDPAFKKERLKVQQFFSFSPFNRFVAQKIQAIKTLQIRDQNIESFLAEYFKALFFSMPKSTILKALQNFRSFSDFCFDTGLYILNLQQLQMIPIRALSALLQYLIELLIYFNYKQQQHQKTQISHSIANLLKSLMKNYEKVSKIPQPFLYSYPKMERNVQFKNLNQVQKKVTEVTQSKVYELKGGICFKLMSLTFYLIKFNPQQNFEFLIQLCMSKMGQKNKSKNYAIKRAVHDFIQVKKDVKNRHLISTLIEEHTKYFNQQDEEIKSLSSSYRRSNSKVDVETDLTPYFIDYFFMKMFYYLQHNCESQNMNVKSRQVNKRYSQIILSYLRQCQQIWDQMNEKNSESNINYQQLSDFEKFFAKQDVQQSERINSPQLTRRFTNDQLNFNFGFIQFGKEQIDSQFYGTPVKESRIRKKSTMGFDLPSSGKKLKQKIIASIGQMGICVWSGQAKQKKLHRYFRDQSKEILFQELLHELYVVNSPSNGNKQAKASKGKRLARFLDEIGRQIADHDTIYDESWKFIEKDVRKVAKYTYSSNPQLKVKHKSFPNLTFPFTIKHNYCTKEIATIHEVNYEPSENQGDQNFNNNTEICVKDEEAVQKDKQLCQISKPKGVYFCEFEFRENKVVFISRAEKKGEAKFDRMLKYGSPQCNIIKVQGKIIELKVDEILEVFYRKYNQIRNNSLQFFLKNGSSLYVIFYTEQRTKKFIQHCKQKFKAFKFLKIVEDFVKSFQNEGYTEAWKRGEISNFDYLMLINKYSGRTFCDLNQYYVFPWVLEDYTSQTLEISNSKIYRDLKKPIGALREQKFSKYQEKFIEMDNKTQQFIYGSHYSTSLFIYYYLVRLEPFTSLHKDMQGGQFDSPDRLFSSIQQMWQCLISQSSTSDIKQAIPQFYYLPTFLKNINSLNLGVKQSGMHVDNVKLPPWASSPIDFILKMRACLQSDYVSSNLNHWIDLIFGKDQKSMQKKNVFHPLSYVQNIKCQNIQSDVLEATMSQITFFGQNPYVLFPNQHPKKRINLNSMHSRNFSISQELIPSSSKNITTKNSMAQQYQQENLDILYFVSEFYFQSKNLVFLKISGISKNITSKSLQLDMQNSIHTLARAVQKIDQPSVKRLMSQNNIEVPEVKLTTNSQVQDQSIKIKIGIKERLQIAKSLKMFYQFNNIKYNEMFFVLYGSSGLRIYDWDEQLIFESAREMGEISECYVDTNLVMFCNSKGKVYTYDFFGKFIQLIFEYSKPTMKVEMLVYQQKKVVTKRNEISYKLIIIGDRRKIVFLHYTHKIGKKKQQSEGKTIF